MLNFRKHLDHFLFRVRRDFNLREESGINGWRVIKVQTLGAGGQDYLGISLEPVS